MRIAAAAILALLAVFGSMSVFQDQLMFPTQAVPPAGSLPSNAVRLQLETSGGETLHGIHFKPVAGPSGPSTLVLGFGGNAWNAQHVAEYLHDIYPAAHVVAFHYRGYRPSTGTPSAEALLEDAPLVFRAAVDKVKPDRVVAVGFSIGSGVASALAGQSELDGLILVTPFDSLKAVAAGLYPWLPVGAFFRHDIDTAAYLEGSEIPVAILAAESDDIIAPARTDGLRPRIRNLRFDRTIAGAGHNDIYGSGEFRQALAKALTAVAGK